MAYTEIVSSGVVASGETISSGTQTVLSGGVTTNCLVSGGSASSYGTLVISGGTVENLSVRGGAARLYMYSGELTNASIANYGVNAWYVGSENSHMVVGGGSILNCTITAGMITTSGNNDQLLANSYIGSVTGSSLSDYRGLLYANIRWGAGTMSGCTVGAGGMVLFGYSNVDNQANTVYGYDNTVAGGSLDLRANTYAYNTTVTGGTLYVETLNCSGTVITGGVMDIYANCKASETVGSGGNIKIRATGELASSTIGGVEMWVWAGGKVSDTSFTNETVFLGDYGNSYLSVDSLANFSNVTVGGVEMSAQSVYVTAGSKIANGAATSVKRAIVEGTFTQYGSGSTVENVTIQNSGWMQSTQGTITGASILGSGARLEALTAVKVLSATVDGYGEFSPTMGAGARLIVFRGATASKTVLQNGGSAHVYGSSTITSTTVKDGGILYMRDVYGTEENNGAAANTTIEDGGILVLGHASNTSGTASLRTLKIAEGGIIHMTGTDFTIMGGSVTDNGKAVGFTAANGAVNNLIMHSGSYFGGYGAGDSSKLNNITVHEGASVTNVSVDGTITGVFVYEDGSTKELNIADGAVNSFVVTQNSVLFGDAENAVNMRDVTILAGGTLSEVNTLSTVSGEYIDADGNSGNFSIADGVAAGLVFNNGGLLLISSGTSADGVSLNAAEAAADGSVATGLALRDGATLMLNNATVSGINYDYLADDHRYSFSTADGVYNNVVIANGGRLTLGDGESAENVYLYGGRSAANAGYGEELFAKTGGASVLEAGDGAVVNGAEFESGAMLSVEGAVTGRDIVLNSGALVYLALTSATGISGVAYGLRSDEDGAGLAMSVSGGKVSNLRVIGENSLLELASGMTAENVEVIGNATITADATNTFTDLYISRSGTFGFLANANGLELASGAMQARATINGATVTGEATLSTSLSAAKFSDVVLKNASNLTLGTAKNQWADAQSGSVIDGVTTNDAFTGYVRFYNGTMKNLTMTAGNFVYDAAGENGDYGRDGISLSFGGSLSFRNTTITNGYTNAMALTTDVTRFELAGGNSINTAITFDGNASSNSAVYITGDGNVIGSAYTVSAAKVIFDVTKLHRAGAGMVNNLNYLAAVTTTGTGTYNINTELRQGYYVLGYMVSGDTTFNKTFYLSVDGGSATAFRVGRDVTKDGYTFSLDTSLSTNYLILTIKADASTNTTFGWKSVKEFAPTYVNDLTETSGVVYLGNTLETAGGHAYRSLGSAISTAAIVTDAQQGVTLYGGANSTGRATSWIKVTGGNKNVVYGGGYNQAMTGGTNIWISGGVCDVYGGGYNSNISSGTDGNAVNITISGGSQRSIYGGGNGGSITGNIAITATNTSVTRIFAAGGMSNVTGNVSASLRLTGSSTANLFGGTVSVSTDRTLAGDASLTLTGGELQGLIFGAGRAYQATNSITGNVTVSASGIVQKDNPKLLASGNSAWLLGGGQAEATSTARVGGDVAISLGVGTTLERVVGGGQANGADAVSSVAGDVSITICGSTINDDVYGGGYAYDNGVSTVEGDVTVTIDASEFTIISGDVYGGGVNPGHYSKGGYASVLGDTKVVFTGNGDYLSFAGTANGDGKIGGTVEGSKVLEFKDFIGDFSGKTKNFDVLMLAGDTFMTASSQTISTSCLAFDLTGRSSAMAEELFMEDAESFDFAKNDKNLAIVVDDDLLSGNFSFALFDATDESLEEVTVTLIGSDGVLAAGALDDVLESGLAVNGKGMVYLNVDDDEVMSVSYRRGALA